MGAIILLTAMFLLTSVGATFAQTEGETKTGVVDAKKSFLYQWTDGTGVVHITDELGKVPEKYRDKAVKLESRKQEGAVEEGRQKTAPPGRPAPEHTDENRKAEWRQRMGEAKQRLTAAQERYKKLDQKRNELLMSWGGAASGRIADREEAERLDEEMKQARKEIDDARAEVEVTIPEDARKAGVPPGWLRE